MNHIFLINMDEKVKVRLAKKNTIDFKLSFYSETIAEINKVLKVIITHGRRRLSVRKAAKKVLFLMVGPLRKKEYEKIKKMCCHSKMKNCILVTLL